MEIKIVYGMREFTQAQYFVDITSCVSADGFPKHFTQQLKGEGFFGFSVKEFSFKVIKSKFNALLYTVRNESSVGGVLFEEYTGLNGLTCATDGMMRAMRYDHVLIYNKTTDELLMRGFVDEIEDWISETPKLKVYPDVVRLKDISAGQEVTDSGNDDAYFEFKSDPETGEHNSAEVMHVREIIQKMLGDTVLSFVSNKNMPSAMFTTDSESCPDPDGSNQISKWLGSVLHKRKNTGLSWNLAKAFIDSFDGSFIRRKEQENQPSGFYWFYEERDAGIIKRILIHKGQWLSINQGQWMDWHFSFPNGLHLETLSFSFEYPNSISLTTLSFSFEYPNGLTLSSLHWEWSYPNGLSLTTLSFNFSYPCGISLTWFSASLDWCTMHVDLGNVVPSLQWTSVNWDFGNIVPSLQWTTAHFDLGQIVPTLGWTTAHWDLGHIIPTLEYASITWQIPSGSINVPSNHVYIPCIGSEHVIYNLAGGDLTFVQGWSKSIFPLVDSVYYVTGSENDDDYGDHIDSLDSAYGSRWDNSGSCDNVPISKVNSFLENDENVNVQFHRVAFDWNDTNSYFITKIKKKWNDMGGSDWLMSFETPFDFYQKVHYKNQKCNDMLKDLAIITNRFFYVDATNRVHLTPRNDTSFNPDKTISRYYFLDRKVTCKRDVDTEVKVKMLKHDSDGKISEYGVSLREAEYEFLVNYYQELMSGDVVTNDIEIVRPTDIGHGATWDEADYPKLMDMVWMDNDGTTTKLGVVIEVAEGTENAQSKYKCQFIRGAES
ncbi:MAG: hypothetical protein CMB80_12430 [Flammeovirgaceae bacterium]|nr:hypothetical protein [Flammeovirgaceae bacterium]|tara:strand:+ start:174 stop:2489 length:2316 start_codon:yes stop_codon:yes gene_type:complete